MGLPPHTKFCKNYLRGIPIWGNLYKKNSKFLRDWGLKAHIFKRTMLKFGVRVRTWDCPHAKFCKNRLRVIPLWGNLYQKFEIFASLSYFSPPFIPIMLKFEQTRETDFKVTILFNVKWLQNGARDSYTYTMADGATENAGPENDGPNRKAVSCIVSEIKHSIGGDAYWFLV